VVNARLYLARSGRAGRIAPVHAIRRVDRRQLAGREPTLAAGVRDSQSVQTTSIGWVLTTRVRPLGAKGSVPLPKHWIVERMFGSFGRYRRLSKDDERNPSSSEAWTCLARTHRTARRLLPARDPTNGLPYLRAILVVGVLALGELSAGKLVEAAGSTAFTHQVTWPTTFDPNCDS
jgi:hypothetical protein